MYKYRQSITDTFTDRDGNLETTKYVYGSQYMDDYLLKNPKNLPLYGPLARKTLMHYAGEHFNPHTICVTIEPFLRMMIKEMVEYKVFHKLKGYDWELIDHMLRDYIGGVYQLDLQVDKAVLKRGFLPQFKAPVTINYKTSH